MRFSIIFLATVLACAGQQRSADSSSQAMMEGHHAVVRRACAETKPFYSAPAHFPDGNPSWVQGKSSLESMTFLRTTIVQVAGFYYDPARVQPRLMMEAIVEGLMNYSEGALTRDGTTLTAGSGTSVKFAIGDVETIWQIPVVTHELGLFLEKNLPPESRLRHGLLAEMVATNAMLSALDRYSQLSPSDEAGKQNPQGAAQANEMQFAAAALPGGIVQVKPGAFSETMEQRVRDAVAATGTAGVILDLRGNSMTGGDADWPDKLADLFVSAGPLLTYNGRDQARVVQARDDQLSSEHVKLVVLMDGETGSGGEMLAGALRSSGRAILLGSRTKGQSVDRQAWKFAQPKGESAELRLLVREALFDGQSFDEVGLAPDVALAPAAAAAPGCAPLGETAVTLRGGDAVEAARRILQGASGASRAELIAAAKSLP
jgi:hypothetical protein